MRWLAPILCVLVTGLALAQTAPYPNSTVITGITFDTANIQNDDIDGDDANGSDNFPITWSDDGHQYTVWGDGWGFDQPRPTPKWTAGVIRIEGTATAWDAIDVEWWADDLSNPCPAPYDCQIGSYGILSIDMSGEGGSAGTLYMWRIGTGKQHTANGAYERFQLWKSVDHGANWTKTGVEWDSIPPFSNTTFLQMGQDYDENTDGYVYSYGFDTIDSGSWEVQTPGRISLMRVTKANIETKAQYEYFDGLVGDTPQWTSTIGDRDPVWEDATNGVMRTSAFYNPGLNRYFLVMQQISRFRSGDGHIGIYDSANPWGPWTTVYFGSPWDDISPPLNLQSASKSVFWNFSSKWTSVDGLSSVLVGTLPWEDEYGHVPVTFSLAPQVCGNDLVEGTEECDGANLDGETCVLRGFDYGILQCKPDCTFSEAYCQDLNPSLPSHSTNTWVTVGEGIGDATFVLDEGSRAGGFPDGRAWFPITYDKSAQRVMILGGGANASCGEDNGYVNDVWELWWTGSAWQWNQRLPDQWDGLDTTVWMQGTDNHSAYYDADNDAHWIVGGTCQSNTVSKGWGYYDYTTNAFVEGTMGVNPEAPPDANFFDPAFAWGNWGEAGHGGAWSGVWVSAGEWNQSSNRTSMFDTSSGTLTANHWLSGVVGPVLTDSVRKQIEEMGVYIPSEKKFMFFGGRGNPSGNMRDDTYEYDPITNTWEHVCGATIGNACGPASRMKAVMAYVARYDAVLLHGGENGSRFSDTWAYDPQTQTWTLLTSSGPALFLHGGAYDSYNDLFVIWSGQTATGENETIYTLRYFPPDPQPIDDLVIVEPAGSARTDEPLTSGVPLPVGTDLSTLSLWDGVTELPVQITQLDSSANSLWALLDFQTTVGSGATKTLTLKEGGVGYPSATPTYPVVVQSGAVDYDIDTGPLLVTIDVDTFDAITTVWNDSDDDGQWDQEIYADQLGNLSLTGRITGSSSSVIAGNQTPIGTTWEYGGPGVSNVNRAVLRMDGRYGTVGSATCPTVTNCLEYTTRFTFYGGKEYVKVEYYIRNEFQDNETTAKIETATVLFGAGSGTTVTLASSGETARAAYVAGGITWELIPSSIYDGATTSSANSGMILYDQSHHGGELLVDFSAAGESGETTIDSPLFALWSERERYPNNGDMTIRDWGTWEEESAVYQAWGWSESGVTKPSLAHEANYLGVDWFGEAVHDDQEQDDVWANLVMYLRLGSTGRGFFDRAQGWARYYQREYAARSRGYEYAWNKAWECPGAGCSDVVRSVQEPSNLTGADTSARTDMQSGKHDIYTGWGGDHTFGWGLVDYYHLTGEVDAVNAAVDIAEIAERVFGARVEGESMSSARRTGRQMLMLTRAAEVMSNATWNTRMNDAADALMSATDWVEDFSENWAFFPDNSGVTDSKYGAGSYAAGIRQIGYVEEPTINIALDRYRNTPDRSLSTSTCGASGTVACDDTHVTARITGLAEFLYLYGLASQADVCSSCTPESPLDDFASDYPAIDIDDNTAYARPWSTTGRPSTSHRDMYTISFVDALVRGYRYTSNVNYINRARYFWHRASKYNLALPWPDCGAMTEGTADTTLCRYLFEGWQGSHHINNGEVYLAAMLFAEGLNSTDTGAPDPAVGTCGDGTVDEGEDCDDDDAVTNDCAYGDSPPLTQVCGDLCTYVDCANPMYCGDGIINGTEVCDDQDFGGETCETQGFDGGALACTSCTSIDTSNCLTWGISGVTLQGVTVE